LFFILFVISSHNTTKDIYKIRFLTGYKLLLFGYDQFFLVVYIVDISIKNVFVLTSITTLNFTHTAFQEAESHPSEDEEVYLTTVPYTAKFQ
jgi:hypothetical protein